MEYKVTAMTVANADETLQKTIEKLKVAGVEYAIRNSFGNKRLFVYGSDTHPVAIYIFIDEKAEHLHDIFHGICFSGSCRELDVSGLRTDNVKDMAELFKGCELDRLDITHFNTSNVTNMAGMFKDAYIRELNITWLDTSNCVSMESMFMNFRGHIVGLETLDTSNVTDMSCMFRSARLQELGNQLFDKLNFGIFNTSKVENMRMLFRDAYIEEVSVEGIDTSKCTDFCDFCRNVSGRIKGAESLDVSNALNLSGMFSDTAFDSELDLSKFNTEKVVDMSLMFSHFAAPRLNISNFDLRSLLWAGQMFFVAEIEELDLPSFKDFKPRDRINPYNNKKETHNEFRTLAGMFDAATIGKCKITDLVIDRSRITYRDSIASNTTFWNGATFTELEVYNCELKYNTLFPFERAIDIFQGLCTDEMKVFATDSIDIAARVFEDTEVESTCHIKCKECSGELRRIFGRKGTERYETEWAVQVYECETCKKRTVLLRGNNCTIQKCGKCSVSACKSKLIYEAWIQNGEAGEEIEELKIFDDVIKGGCKTCFGDLEVEQKNTLGVLYRCTCCHRKYLIT